VKVTVVLTCGNKILLDDAEEIMPTETVFSVIREGGGYVAVPADRIRYWIVDV